MKDIPDAPWIGNDDYGKYTDYTQYDYEYDHQDDQRDWEWEQDHRDELREEDDE